MKFNIPTEHKNKSGIYKIVFQKVNDKTPIYIGQTKEFELRHKDHLQMLRLKKHHCHLLQIYFDYFNTSNISFEFIQCCEVDKLRETELNIIMLYELDITYKVLNSSFKIIESNVLKSISKINIDVSKTVNDKDFEKSKYEVEKNLKRFGYRCDYKIDSSIFHNHGIKIFQLARMLKASGATNKILEYVFKHGKLSRQNLHIIQLNYWTLKELSKYRITNLL